MTKYLLDGYDAGVRPAENSSQPLAVVFGLSLHHIIDVVSKENFETRGERTLLPEFNFKLDVKVIFKLSDDGQFSQFLGENQRSFFHGRI